MGALSCDSGPKRLDSVPAELEPRVAAANTAIAELKQTLSGRLLKTVKASGPKAGVAVCSAEAKTMTQKVGERHRVQLGRTSAKLRNPKDNLARPWLKPYLAEISDKKAVDVKPAVFDLGSSLGVVQPLGTKPLCLNCHGDPASIPAEVKAELSARYPGDRATGFSKGDVRGVVWVEIPKEP